MATASVTNTLVALTLAEASDVNQNFGDLVTFLNSSTMHRDASSAFTAVPSGPATDPSSDNQLARKAYVDGQFGMVTYSGPTNTSTTPAEVFNSFSSVIARGITATATGLTVVTAGWYDVGIDLRWNANNNGDRRNVGLRYNGSTVGAASNDSITTTSLFGVGLHIGRPMNLAVADTLGVSYSQNSGTLLNCTVYLWARRIR